METGFKRNLLAELDASPETFVFLGSYSEL